MLWVGWLLLPDSPLCPYSSLVCARAAFVVREGLAWDTLRLGTPSSARCFSRATGLRVCGAGRVVGRVAEGLHAGGLAQARSISLEAGEGAATGCRLCRFISWMWRPSGLVGASEAWVVSRAA